MTQEQKLLANFNCCLIMLNKQLAFFYRNQLNKRVLQLQVNLRSKIGKYLMAKTVQLRFLCDVAIVVCASCFLLKAYLRKQHY